MRKLFWMAFGMVALSAMILPLSFSTFAHDDDDDDDRPKVESSKWRCKGKGEHMECECKTQNKFRTSEDVYAKGEHFPPLTNVDIYVTANKKWNSGDSIGSDVGDGVDMVATDSEGEIPCTKIWGKPLTVGSYDIVVDANQDGTYNTGDAIDGRSMNRGFKVK